MELDTNPTKLTKCVRLIRSPTYRELTVYIYNNIYLLKSLIYIEYNTNSGYKWTPQEVIDLYML